MGEHKGVTFVSLQHQHPEAAHLGERGPERVRTEAHRGANAAPRTGPGPPGPHFTSPGPPHPAGEGSRPRLGTVAGPTAQRGPASACCGAALALLGASFCSLHHLRDAAFLRGRARARPQAAPALRPRPPRALCARCPLSPAPSGAAARAA